MTKKLNHHLPLVIAHRGSSGRLPENTMIAFEGAVHDDADGIELDIFLTADSKIVVTHDSNTTRLTGVKKLVRQSTLKELRRLDFGQGEKIPTLDDVFETFLPQLKFINVEIKSHGHAKTSVEQKLAKLIKDFDCAEQILVSSFNPLHLFRFRHFAPNVRIGYLLSAEQRFYRTHGLAIHRLKPDTLNFEAALLDKPNTNALFDKKTPLWLWRVDGPGVWEKCAGNPQVEALITDHPAQVRQLFKDKNNL